MASQTLTLNTEADRHKAMSWCKNAAPGTRVVWSEGATRTQAQNDFMWDLLTDISKQMFWPPESGIRITKEDYKLIMMSQLKTEMRVVPNYNLDGYVNIGRSSSKLNKREFADLIELILAFGAKYGVHFQKADQSMLKTYQPTAQEREDVGAG